MATRLDSEGAGRNFNRIRTLGIQMRGGMAAAAGRGGHARRVGQAVPTVQPAEGGEKGNQQVPERAGREEENRQAGAGCGGVGEGAERAREGMGRDRRRTTQTVVGGRGRGRAVRGAHGARRGQRGLQFRPSLIQQSLRLVLSSQFWPMWSKSRRGVGQLPFGRSPFIRLNGWLRNKFTLSIPLLDFDGIGQN